MATTYHIDKHDIGILRQDGSTKCGLMLARKDGVPIYETWDDEYIAQQQTETAGYEALPAEKEVAIIGDSWRSGFGQETYNSADPERYFASYNTDLRFKGMAICSPKATAVTKPASKVPRCFANFNGNLYAGIDDELCKLDSDGDEFANVSTLPSNIVGLEPFSDGHLYLALEDTTNVIEDCEDAWNELVDGDVTASTSSYAKVGSACAKFVCAAGLGAGDIIATEAITSTDLSSFTTIKLWFNCNVDLSAGDLQLLLDDTANCASPVEAINLPAYSKWDGWERMYLTLANPASDTAIISVGLKQVNDKGAMTIYIDDIRVDAYHYRMDENDQVSTTSTSNAVAHAFKTVNADASTIWKVEKPNSLRSSTDPSSSWSAVTEVDMPTYDITSLVEVNNSLFVTKEDAPYYLDSSGNVKLLTGKTKCLTSSTGGKNSIAWGDTKLYMPYGTQSLLEYDVPDAKFAWLDPSLSCTNLDDFSGQIQALAADEQWLYAVVDNSTKVEVLAGRYETIDSTTSWVWHPIVELTLAGCETAFVSNVYKKALYIASTSGSDSLYKILLYDDYGDPVNDGNASFQTDGYFITPWMHAKFKGDSKAFVKITLTMAGTSANVYWEAHYQKKGDASWTDIGDFKTSPTTSAYIPVDGSSNKPVSTMMRFKFVAKTNSTSSTPILYSYDVRGILYPSHRKLTYCVVRGADGITLKDDTVDEDSSAAAIETVIEEAKYDATWPVTIYDIYGNTKYVKFLPVRPASRMVKDEKSRNLERHWYLLMQEVTLS